MTTSNPVWRGRATLIALVVFFSIPAVSAYLILANQWYQPGVTNQGQLIEPRLTYQNLGVTYQPEKPMWQLAYIVPKQCDESCQQRLYLLRQSYLALGKYQERVEPVMIVQGQSDARVIAQADINTQMVDALPETVAVGEDVIIIDPLGQWVMRYSLGQSDAEKTPQLMKGMLRDFKKLLKLSRVG